MYMTMGCSKCTWNWVVVNVHDDGLV